MIRVIEKGHWCAEIDDSNLEDADVRFTMHPLETCESQFMRDGEDLMKEHAALCRMVTEYINYLYGLREEALACAV